MTEKGLSRERDPHGPESALERTLDGLLNNLTIRGQEAGEGISERERGNAKRALSAIVAGVVAFFASAEALDARVQTITVRGADVMVTSPESAPLTIAKMEIPAGTMVLRIGPSEFLPKNMWESLREAPADSDKTARNSKFALQGIEEQPPSVKGGSPTRTAVYKTMDGKPLMESQTVQIPTTVPADREEQLRVVTDDDRGISFERAGVSGQKVHGPDVEGSQGISSHAHAETVVSFPLNDEGSLKLEFGAVGGMESGKPGTGVAVPPGEGNQWGGKGGPMLGFSWVPFERAQLRGSVEPNISKPPLEVSKNRPAVFLGSWTQRSDDPNWWEYKVTSIAEVGDEKTIGTIPRFQTGATLDKAFVDQGSGTGLVLGIGARSSFLAERGWDSRKPFILEGRIGVTKTLPIQGKPYELKIMVGGAPGKDDPSAFTVEASLEQSSQ